MKKIILVLLIFLVILISSCEPVEDDEPEDKYDEVDKEDEVGFAGITKIQCMEAGGHWNECGSPCAGTGAEMCIQVCKVQCECGGIAGFACPEGFECRLSGKIVDEIGVCVEE